MPYPKNYIGISISEETHQRLTNLKRDGETYSDVLENLLNLEEKYTVRTETFEYEYMLKNQKTKLFRVTFSDKVTIEYYNRKTFKFEEDIRAWYTGNRISEDELNSFIRFIVKESNLYVLYEMDEELVINDIWIRRVWKNLNIH